MGDQCCWPHFALEETDTQRGGSDLPVKGVKGVKGGAGLLLILKLF